MQIVRHEAKEVDVGLHGLDIESTQIPVVGRQGQADAVLAAVCCPHLLHQQNELALVSQFISASVRVTGILPANVDTSEAVLVHVVLRRRDEGSTTAVVGNHPAPGEVSGRALVTEVKAANGNPCLQSGLGEVGELAHHGWIIGMSMGDLVGDRVDGGK